MRLAAITLGLFLFQCTIANDLYFTPDSWSPRSNGAFEFSVDDYISTVSSFSQRMIFFILSRRVLAYSIEDGDSLDLHVEFKHEIPNAYHEYIHGFCTSDYLVLLKKHTMYFYKIFDSQGIEPYKLRFPASYFNVSMFTEVSTINQRGSTMIAKTGRNQAHLFNFLSVIHPTSHALHLPSKDETDDIRAIRAVDNGLAAAIFYSKSVELISLDHNQHFHRLRGYYFDLDVKYVVYDFPSNTLLVFFRPNLGEKTGKVMFLGLADTSGKPPYRNLTSFSNDMTIHRFGIDHLSYFELQEIFIFNMRPKLCDQLKTWAYKLTMPEPLAAENFTFNYTYQYSNLVMVSKKDKDKITMFHLAIEGNSVMCHPSCDGKCLRPFVVCTQKWQITFGMVLSVFCVAAIVLCVYRISSSYERWRNKARKKPSKKLKKALTYLEMDDPHKSDALKFRFKPSRMSPSMVEAIHDELINPDESSDDDSPSLLKQSMPSQVLLIDKSTENFKAKSTLT